MFEFRQKVLRAVLVAAVTIQVLGAMLISWMMRARPPWGHPEFVEAASEGVAVAGEADLNDYVVDNLEADLEELLIEEMERERERERPSC